MQCIRFNRSSVFGLLLITYAATGCSVHEPANLIEPAERNLTEQIGEVFAGRSNEIRVTQREVRPEDLAQLEAVDDSLERLNLGRTTLDDESLRGLGRFKKLV